MAHAATDLPPSPAAVADDRGRALRAEAVAGLGTVAAGDWDALVPAGHGPVRHGFLAAWSRAELPDLRPRPLVVRDRRAGAPVAVAPGWRYTLDLGLVHRLPRPVEALRRRLPERLSRLGIYELGTPAALCPPLLAGDAGPDGRTAAMLVEAAVREADRTGARLAVVQNFTGDDQEPAPALRAAGFVRTPIPPTAILRLGFASFDDYLAAMRSPYRRRARQVLARSGHLRVERLEAFAGLAPELAGLSRLVHERADVRREVLSERFFAAAAELAEVSVLLLRRTDGSIASFALLLDDGVRLHFLACGFEEEAGRSEGAYFRLLYEIVRAGIDGGAELVDFGITTLEPKLDVGAVPVPLFAWVRHRHPLVRRALAAFGARVLAPRPPEPRTVFKDGSRQLAYAG